MDDSHCKVAEVICSRTCIDRSALCKIVAILLSISLVSCRSNMIEMGQLMYDSLYFFSIIRVVKCELAHVNGLCRITWVDISVSVSVTTVCRIGRAIVDGVISNRGHDTENIGHCTKLQ